MLSSRFFGRQAVPAQVIGGVDVSWSAEFVARDE
jgi:hypothetical protein